MRSAARLASCFEARSFAEAIREDANRARSALLLVHRVLAAFRRRELDRFVDDVLDDVVVAFIAPRDRVAGRNADERLLHFQDGVNGEGAAVQFQRQRHPRIADVELPGVVAALAHQEIAVDRELQLDRRTGKAVDGDDEIVRRCVIERQIPPLLVGDAADVVLAERRARFDEVLFVHVELQDVLRGGGTGDRLGDIELRVVAVRRQRVVDRGKHKRRPRRRPVIAADRLRGEHARDEPFAEPAVVAVGLRLVDGVKRLVRVVERVVEVVLCRRETRRSRPSIDGNENFCTARTCDFGATRSRS